MKNSGALGIFTLEWSSETTKTILNHEKTDIIKAILSLRLSTDFTLATLEKVPLVFWEQVQYSCIY